MVFKDKVVVITGAGSGIGRALALTYAGHGAKNIIIDKNEEDLQQTAKMIENTGNKVFSYALDLTDSRETGKVFEDISLLLNRIDVLVNNAGLWISKSLYELTVEEWDYVINTNLRGAFLCSREAAKIMRKNGGGSIVNISSTRAQMSEPDAEAYAASKGGLLALTHALAVSLGPDKIRVNAVSPGWIETGDYQKLRPADHQQHPAGRVGKSEDIARACLYLSDPENDFVTGANLIVDGGMTRKMIYEI